MMTLRAVLIVAVLIAFAVPSMSQTATLPVLTTEAPTYVVSETPAASETSTLPPMTAMTTIPIETMVPATTSVPVTEAVTEAPTTMVPMVTAVPATLAPPPSPTPNGYLPPQHGLVWTVGQGGNNERTSHVSDTLGFIVPIQRWSTVALIVGPVAVYNGKVFGTYRSPYNTNCQLSMFRETTGEMLGNYTFPDVTFCSAPTIDPSTNSVLVQTGGANKLHTTLSAFDASTLMQTFNVTGFSTNTQPYGMVVLNGSAYAPGGASNSLLYAVDLTTQAPKWQQILFEGALGPDYGYWGPTVFRAGSADPQVLWNTQHAANPSNCVVGGVNAKTGSKIWSLSFACNTPTSATHSYTTAASDSIVLAQLRVKNGYYVATTSIVAIHIDASSNARVLWTFNSSVTNPHIATDADAAYIPTGNNGVVAVSLNNGTILRTYASNIANVPPLVVEDYVIVADYNSIDFYRKHSAELVMTITQQTTSALAYHGGWLFATSAYGVNAYQLITSPW